MEVERAALRTDATPCPEAVGRKEAQEILKKALECGALAASSDGDRLAATGTAELEQRFLLGRALAHLGAVRQDTQARLLTAASGWQSILGRSRTLSRLREG
jgi:hypothetical protein